MYSRRWDANNCVPNIENIVMSIYSRWVSLEYPQHSDYTELVYIHVSKLNK